MKTSRVFSAVAAAALAAGCAARPIAIPVIGPLPEVNALVGDWSGEYSSGETGRSGNIAFSLGSGDDAAIGSIVMMPRPSNDAVPFSANTDRPVVRTGMPQDAGDLLTIRFVRMEGNQLIGTLDPYRDPEDGCKVTTMFRGEFKNADTIEGTFTTVGTEVGHTPSSGKWRVTRLIK
jgi:hypothetical protein